MEAKKVIIIVLTIVFISSLATGFFYKQSKYYEIREVSMQIEVADKLGLNTDPGSLNFGVNAPGNTVTRFMDVRFPKTTQVSVAIDGEIGGWVVLNDNQFPLYPDQTKRLEFKVYIPDNATYGSYESTAIFYFKKP